MGILLSDTELVQVLYRSPVVRCEKCCQPIASQAELDYIASKIGDSAWQHLCLECRTQINV